MVTGSLGPTLRFMGQPGSLIKIIKVPQLAKYLFRGGYQYGDEDKLLGKPSANWLWLRAGASIHHEGVGPILVGIEEDESSLITY